MKFQVRSAAWLQIREKHRLHRLKFVRRQSGAPSISGSDVVVMSGRLVRPIQQFDRVQHR